MSDSSGPFGWHHQMLQNWLLLILKFAITREDADRAAILDQATALDSLDQNQPERSFCYFVQTSRALCDAVQQNETQASRLRLLQHAARIDNPRLKQAFLGAIGLNEQSRHKRSSARQQNKLRSDHLWRGLR